MPCDRQSGITMRMRESIVSRVSSGALTLPTRYRVEPRTTPLSLAAARCPAPFRPLWGSVWTSRDGVLPLGARLCPKSLANSSPSAFASSSSSSTGAGSGRQYSREHEAARRRADVPEVVPADPGMAA